jgi:hypothetical protein
MIRVLLDIEMLFSVRCSELLRILPNRTLVQVPRTISAPRPSTSIPSTHLHVNSHATMVIVSNF